MIASPRIHYIIIDHQNGSGTRAPGGSRAYQCSDSAVFQREGGSRVCHKAALGAVCAYPGIVQMTQYKSFYARRRNEAYWGTPIDDNAA